MTLERFSEWIEQNFSLDRYGNVYDLVNAVEQRVNSDGNEMNDNVRQLLLENFASHYDPRIKAMEERLAIQQEVADMLGSGKVIESLSDEILQDLRNPRAEILGIDMTEFATTRESVIPPEIQRFAHRESFFTRVVSTFRKFLKFGR